MPQRPELSDATVAVYLDFDNIVISRYDQVHGNGRFMRERTKGFDLEALDAAEVDIHAILDFASSFGRLVLTRAYADWSVPVNARYRKQLVERAVDLVQLFPAAAYGKNGADIRLAVDALEDASRMPHVGTVVLAAGDSDYIPLAQRLKRLGRYVVAVGVAGSTSRSLGAACDELVSYDNLPGVADAAAEAGAATVPDEAPPAAKAPAATKVAPRKDAQEKTADTPPDGQRLATRLLGRAVRLVLAQEDESEWVHASAVKSQMKRMDPSFSEKELGFRSFSDFVKSRNSLVELDESSQVRMVRLR